MDANTSEAQAWLSASKVPLQFAPLHSLEVRNALRLGIFRGIFLPADVAVAWQNLEDDLRAGRLMRTAVNWAAAFRIAARLSDRYSAEIGTRSLDVLHVACAKAVRSTTFLSFDARQRNLATAAGLNVAP